MHPTYHVHIYYGTTIWGVGVGVVWIGVLLQINCTNMHILYNNQKQHKWIYLLEIILCSSCPWGKGTVKSMLYHPYTKTTLSYYYYYNNQQQYWITTIDLK